MPFATPNFSEGVLYQRPEGAADRYYRPRMRAKLTVPTYEKTAELSASVHGRDTTEIDAVVHTAHITRNDHNHADELSITAEWRDCGIDPRFIKSATVKFYMDDAGPSGHFEPGPDNLQFTGIAVRVRREAKTDSGFSCTIDFHDYTSFFIAQKPFSKDGMPKFGMTLRQAWEKICDNTGYWDVGEGKIKSAVESFKKSIRVPQVAELNGVTLERVIGKGTVLNLIERFGMPEMRDKNAWDVWTTLCTMLGYVTFIDNDECIVTDTTEHYSSEKAPYLVWGDNIAELEEHADSTMNQKGVCLTSFDSVHGHIIEAYYPPPGDPRIKVKRSVANSGKKKYPHVTASDPQSEQYEYYPVNWVQDQGRLEALAQFAYEERARQEFQGRLKTNEIYFTNPTTSELYSVFALRAGDLIHVEIDKNVRESLASNKSANEKESYLEGLGYSKPVIGLLLKNADAFSTLKSDFHIKQISISLEETSFSVEISYHNLIDVSGNVDDPDALDIPNVPGRFGGL